MAYFTTGIKTTISILIVSNSKVSTTTPPYSHPTVEPLVQRCDKNVTMLQSVTSVARDMDLLSAQARTEVRIARSLGLALDQHLLPTDRSMSVAEVPVGTNSAGPYSLSNPLKTKTTTSQEWDPKAERRVLRKVDLLLMPILTFSYGLQFVCQHRLFDSS